MSLSHNGHKRKGLWSKVYDVCMSVCMYIKLGAIEIKFLKHVFSLLTPNSIGLKKNYICTMLEKPICKTKFFFAACRKISLMQKVNPRITLEKISAKNSFVHFKASDCKNTEINAEKTCFRI